jgi:hypothetical protein
MPRIGFVLAFINVNGQGQHGFGRAIVRGLKKAMNLLTATPANPQYSRI